MPQHSPKHSMESFKPQRQQPDANKSPNFEVWRYDEFIISPEPASQIRIYPPVIRPAQRLVSMTSLPLTLAIIIPANKQSHAPPTTRWTATTQLGLRSLYHVAASPREPQLLTSNRLYQQQVRTCKNCKRSTRQSHPCKQRYPKLTFPSTCIISIEFSSTTTPDQLPGSVAYPLHTSRMHEQYRVQARDGRS
jgi:hypothetical protein